MKDVSKKNSQYFQKGTSAVLVSQAANHAQATNSAKSAKLAFTSNSQNVPNALSTIARSVLPPAAQNAWMGTTFQANNAFLVMIQTADLADLVKIVQFAPKDFTQKMGFVGLVPFSTVGSVLIRTLARNVLGLFFLIKEFVRLALKIVSFVRMRLVVRNA